MGLFHYLIILETDNTLKESQIEKFFCSKEFLIVERRNSYVSLIRKSPWGDLEVLIEKTGVSIRTKIQNKVAIIDEIIKISKQFSEEIKKNTKIYDVQNKQLINLSNAEELKNLYLSRQNELKKYFN